MPLKKLSAAELQAKLVELEKEIDRHTEHLRTVRKEARDLAEHIKIVAKEEARPKG